MTPFDPRANTDRSVCDHLGNKFAGSARSLVLFSWIQQHSRTGRWVRQKREFLPHLSFDGKVPLVGSLTGRGLSLRTDNY